MMARDRTFPRNTFLWRGSHPVLDFLNTQGRRAGAPFDLLEQPEALEAWLGHAGLACGWPRARGDQDDGLARALHLRSVLRGLVESVLQSDAIADRALTDLNELLAGHPCQVAIRSTGGTCLKVFLPVEPDPLAALRDSAVDLLCGQDWHLIRQCQSMDCLLLFLDLSRNHSRRWCSMQACGNRSKVAAHHQRRTLNP